MKRELRENFPQMPAGYEERVSRTLDQVLEMSSVPADLTVQVQRSAADAAAFPGNGSGRRKAMRRWVTASSSFAAVFVLCIIGFFTAFPAYAADIPVLNRIIYTISPLVKETGEGEQKVAQKTAEVLKEFMESNVIMYTGKENLGDSWELNTATLQAAYYFKNRICKYFEKAHITPPEVTIEVREVEAKRRGYEIMAEISCDVLSDGEYCFSENIEAVLIEKPGVLTVVGMWEADPEEGE
ncbi:MAG: DUF4179 domain-containing protein [Lachnospiraceae bacterium]|nr:DUF4179 domain-containing protein [Lachnospiraceae bacterium]